MLDPKLLHVVSQWSHDRPLHACRFDTQGRYLLTAGEDALVERYQLSDGAKVVFSGGHTTWVLAIAVAKDGSAFVSGGADGKLTWWETASSAPAPLRQVAGHQGWVRSLAVSPDGVWLASGGNDNAVRLWNMVDGQPIREFSGHLKHVYSVAFHPQGGSLVTGDLAGAIKQWDLATGQEIRTFDGKPLHSFNEGQRVDFGGVRALAISADGKWLAAGGTHKSSNPLGAVHEPLVCLFDLTSEKPEAARQWTADGITQAAITRVCWLSDGTLMAAAGGGSGGLLLFWNTSADKDYFRFGLPNIVRDMDLHPDGLHVATTHFDRHARLLKLAAKAG